MTHETNSQVKELQDILAAAYVSNDETKIAETIYELNRLIVGIAIKRKVKVLVLQPGLTAVYCKSKGGRP